MISRTLLGENDSFKAPGYGWFLHSWRFSSGLPQRAAWQITDFSVARPRYAFFSELSSFSCMKAATIPLNW